MRLGPSVQRLQFGDLDAAVAEMRRRVERISADGPLEKVSMLRDFEPSQRVHARLEISGPGLLRPPTAGVDVMGDGRLVAFSGGIRRQELKPRRGDDEIETIQAALRRRVR